MTTPRRKPKPPKAHTLAQLLICERCGDSVARKNATLVRPYEWEIHGVKVPCILCVKCTREEVRDT